MPLAPFFPHSYPKTPPILVILSLQDWRYASTSNCHEKDPWTCFFKKTSSCTVDDIAGYVVTIYIYIIWASLNAYIIGIFDLCVLILKTLRASPVSLLRTAMGQCPQSKVTSLILDLEYRVSGDGTISHPTPSVAPLTRFAFESYSSSVFFCR